MAVPSPSPMTARKAIATSAGEQRHGAPLPAQERGDDPDDQRGLEPSRRPMTKFTVGRAGDLVAELSRSRGAPAARSARAPRRQSARAARRPAVPGPGPPPHARPARRDERD